MRPQVSDTTTTDSQPNSLLSKKLWLRGIVFVFLGLLIYLGLYALSEAWVYEYGLRNRFYVVKTSTVEDYGYVFLGASRAMPFDFDGINQHLEEMSNTKIINLSIEGGGILPNRLLLDYFLVEHTTTNVVYFLDSFAFYSEQWNEKRLTDADLLRAPLDPSLISVLWRYPWARHLIIGYVTGFNKINNENRFEPDITEAEAARFDREYRPIPQIDRQRISFLYPDEVDSDVLEKYLTEFERLVQFLQERDITLIIIKLPLPDRVLDMLPHEVEFDAILRERLAQYQDNINFYDFSHVSNSPEYFYDTDHLNRAGVIAFSEEFLSQILERYKHQ
jgi:hypothetical protein